MKKPSRRRFSQKWRVRTWKEITGGVLVVGWEQNQPTSLGCDANVAHAAGQAPHHSPVSSIPPTYAHLSPITCLTACLPSLLVVSTWSHKQLCVGGRSRFETNPRFPINSLGSLDICYPFNFLNPSQCLSHAF